MKKTLNTVHLLFNLVFSAKTRQPTFKLLLTIWLDFFWAQWRLKLKLARKNITSIIHPADHITPYNPARYPIYLSFIAEIMDTLLLIRKHSHTTWQTEIINYIQRLTKLYQISGSIHSRNPTTTTRFFRAQSLRSWLILLTDPHYHCLPSLHVSIVCLNYTFIGSIWNGEPVQKKKMSKQLYQTAVLISRSVLEVKQHSIYCIVAALILMEKLFSTWSPADSLKMMEDLSYISEISTTSQVELYTAQKTLYFTIKEEIFSKTHLTEGMRQLILEIAKEKSQEVSLLGA